MLLTLFRRAGRRVLDTYPATSAERLASQLVRHRARLAISHVPIAVLKSRSIAGFDTV